MSIRGGSGGGDCKLNPKCCYDTHDLECPNKFYPPLLSTPTDFCAEVLAKGLPIPKCALAKPKKLIIEREPPPLAKPKTARHLKNWQRWCYIWRHTYNTLTAKRNAEAQPPVMSSGEVTRLKKEDKELFDRTLHTYHLDGFYVKNAFYPDSVTPKPKGDKTELREVITKRYLRDFPEMKRQRYPNFVRNEVSLPPRKIPPKGHKTNTPKRTQNGFNWEEQWAKTKHVVEMKEALACDIGLYGKTDPFPDNLIFKPIVSKDGPSERIYEKKLNKKGDLSVPQLVFSEDNDENTQLDSLTNLNDDKKGSKDYYNEQRGPILRIRSLFSEIVLTLSKAAAEMPHFIKNPSTASIEEEYFYDDNQHFSITTKCKDMRFIVLKNEGTTAIRYQWFRYPPNRDSQRMLQDTTEYKSLRLSNDLDTDKSQFHSGQESVFENDSSEPQVPKVPKKSHLEFHFSELPGVILPGQSLEFPIIFRSKRPGYFHETLYLLTHPRLNTENGRYYAVSLSGVCTDLELAEKGNEKYETEGLKRYLNEKIFEEESIDLMDSILDRSLSDVTNPSSSSLPEGRVTAESVFYAHNKNYYYYYGKSEKALELVGQLIEMLVPVERVEHFSECHQSIQSLYNLVTSAREKDDLYWSNLRTSECEDLLDELNDCMVTLSQQRLFSWPATERRKYVAVYTNMLSTFDEILLGCDRLHNFYNAPVMKHIDSLRAESMVHEYLKEEEEREELLKQMEMEQIGEVAEANFQGPSPPSDEEFIDLEGINGSNSTPEEVGTAAGEKMDQVVEVVKEEEEDDDLEAYAFWLSGFEKISSLSSKENMLHTDESSSSSEVTQEIVLKPQPPKKATALTLQETMQELVDKDRQQVLTEARIKLFEDVMCEGIERMLSTVDSFNNMLDYRSSDAIVFIDDLC